MGGGDFASSLNNCILSSNSARSGASEIWAAGRGGGACMSVLNNCVLTDNSAWIGGGASGGTLNNCVLTRNRAQTGGGASGNDYFGVLGLSGGDLMYVPVWEPAFLNNCTLAGNTAEFGGGTFACGANNCIIYHNTATNGPNWYEYENITFSHWYGPEIVTFSSCCTTPMPTNGVGNFTNAPLFVDPGNGAFRLQPDSPCINAGENNYVTTSTDLAGNQRISGSTVDVGAYEFVFTPAMLAGQLILEVEKTNLGDKNKQPLLAALLAALSSFDRGDTSAALNQLSAFQNKVREQVAPRNSALAAEWTAAVRQIIAAASGH
jgi:hypothetical protein